MDSKLTIDQENFLDAKYAELSYCLIHAHWITAEQIIKEIESKEFFAQAEDMKQLLAAKQLHA